MALYLLSELLKTEEQNMNRIAKIKSLIDNGVPVFDQNQGYECKKDRLGQYLIVYKPNGYCIGLTDQTGTKLNATKPFYMNNGEPIYL